MEVVPLTLLELEGSIAIDLLHKCCCARKSVASSGAPETFLRVPSSRSNSYGKAIEYTSHRTD
jgi:hypothetical protein